MFTRLIALLITFGSVTAGAEEVSDEYLANILNTNTVSSALEGLKKDHSATCLKAKSKKIETVYENTKKNIFIKNSEAEMFCYGCSKHGHEVEFLVVIQSQITQQMLDDKLDTSVWINSIDVHQAPDPRYTKVNGCDKTVQEK